CQGATVSLSERLEAARRLDEPAATVAPGRRVESGTFDLASSSRSDVLKALKARAVTALFERIGNRLSDASMTQERLHEFVRSELAVIVASENVSLGEAERAALIREIEDDALGLGPIQRLLDDDSVTEIMVNHAGQIFVEK